MNAQDQYEAELDGEMPREERQRRIEAWRPIALEIRRRVFALPLDSSADPPSPFSAPASFGPAIYLDPAQSRSWREIRETPGQFIGDSFMGLRVIPDAPEFKVQ
jgi:hypothetical protein